jgi:cobalt transporter subunit CbtB
VRTACLVAFLIGVAMVFTVGFAHTEILHNAAHDTRHSLAFPCH